MKSLLPIALLPCLLSACAADDTRYPSLARRAVEDADFREPPATTPAPPTSDPALDARIAALLDRLKTVAAGFDRDAAAARRLVAVRGAGTTGSEPWLAAQSALAELDDWRAQTGSIAADADDLGSERAAKLLPPYPVLTAAQGKIAAEVARQGKVLDGLQGN